MVSGPFEPAHHAATIWSGLTSLTEDCLPPMRTFILRVRKGPTTPDFSLDDLPGAGRMEIVPRIPAPVWVVTTVVILAAILAVAGIAAVVWFLISEPGLPLFRWLRV